MDDLAGLDRLDRWLNAQRGKQRLVLTWLDAWPLATILVTVLWTVWSFSGPVPVGYLPAVAVAQPLAIPASYLASGIYARRAREGRRNPAKFCPRFSWRRFAAQVLILCVTPLGPLISRLDEASIVHNQPPIVFFLAFMLACNSPLALMLWNDHYLKRAAKIRLATAPQRPLDIAPHQVSRVP